jgi:uncharacterized phage protein gp47/JayE
MEIGGVVMDTVKTETAFKSKTAGEIRELILEAFHAKFETAFRLLPKSFLNVIATVFAGVYITLYKQIGWVFLQMFPDTAYWGEAHILGKSVRPLVQWGMLVGAGGPRAGTRWEGVILVLVTRAGAKLAAGAQLQSEMTGKLYITTKEAALENQTEAVPVVCAEYGAAGNLELGDALSFVSPFGFVRRDAVVSAVTASAKEAETESEYRARVVEYCRNPAFGGALADYRRWAREVPGVLNAYPYQGADNPGDVLVYVSADSPSRVPEPGSDLLVQVGKACVYDSTNKATRKPLGAVVDPAGDGSYTNIRAVSVVSFDVYIDGIAAGSAEALGEAVLPSLKSYFLDREPYIRGLSDDNNKTDIISRSNVMRIVDQASSRIKADFENVRILCERAAEETACTLGTGELAELGQLHLIEAELNGVAYEQVL